MYRIAINGINSKIGGGRTILFDYMKHLNRQESGNRYFLLTTNPGDFDWISNDKITVVEFPTYYGNMIFAPVIYEFIINNCLEKKEIDVVFNFGDLIINTKVSQIYLFDWSYALYPNSIIWKRMGWYDRFIRKIKLHLIKIRLHHPTVVIAQTQVVKESLENLYGLTNSVKVVPNSISLVNVQSVHVRKPVLPSGTRLLCLTHYYPNKNLEVCLPLAERIRDAGYDYKIIMTIDEIQHPKAVELLRNIQDKGLNEIIINVGSVPIADVPSLYKACHALLLPTLLESFSATYVEAMFHGIPIFTSNLDFARGVCGDAACYFDPLDPDDILRTLNEVFDDSHRVDSLVETGRDVLSNLPGPVQVFYSYQKILNHELDRISSDAK